VDGTANFARANPLFCVCISVVEGDEVKHAAVGAPRLGDIYHASSGGGTFRDSATGETYPLRVANAERLEDSFAGVDVSYAGGSDLKNNILEVFRSCWQVRSLGSAGIRGAGSQRDTSTSPSVPATPPGTTPPPPSSSPRPAVA
jgi:myo-inositol-1(or 4)-monophosphatase